MIERDLPAGSGMVARIRFSERVDGDFRIGAPPSELGLARRAIAPGDWTWLHQVHGADVVAVDAPGAGAGSDADASVTTVPGAVLSVQTADCAPVVLVAGPCVAAVHAGWRGLVAGVLPAAVAELRRRSREPVRAVLGPCIRAAGYEFGSEDLERVVAVAGEAARGQTEAGRPALDLGGAVGALLAELDVGSVDDTGLDTSDPRFFSHRTRADDGRQVAVVWLEPT
jgi:YfiH family protein